MKIMIYSELEMLVREDMMRNGFDPDTEIELYWSTRL
jgi:hypothetical protein